jgi:hypothetical protein
MRLAILVLCFAATIAHAQPAHMMASPSGASNTPTSEEKSASTAVILSIGIPVLGATTVVASHGSPGPALLGAGALFLGPSIGRWYAGDSAGGTLAIRGAGILAIGAGLVGMYGISEADCRANDQPCHSPVPFQALAIGGATVVVGTWVYDVVQAKRGADRWNLSHGVSLTPGLVGNRSAPGLFVSGQF